MSTKQKINRKYAELCTKLGDLLFKKDCLESEIAELLQKIKNLNSLQPELVEALNEQSAPDTQSIGSHSNQGSGV